MMHCLIIYHIIILLKNNEMNARIENTTLYTTHCIGYNYICEHIYTQIYCII